MTMFFNKEQSERRAFEALAPLIGLAVIPGTIQQLRPPAPDIQCEVTGIGHYNAELVALDDDTTRRRLNNMYNSEKALERAIGSLTPEEQATVSAEMADVHISMIFDENAGTRDRGKLVTGVLRELLARPAGFRGDIYGDLDDLPRGLHSATIARFKKANGPTITSPSAGYWCPPQLEQITTKLKDKTYQCSGRLELFAYSIHDEPDGAVGGLEGIEQTIRQDIGTSKFDRVHVFHVGFLKHILTLP
ncbi:MAG TPA: hypothetical protein VHW95_06535 [Steroidobacteraceae bacterium]|nr:hypothetical protein [Steroidobacteraceae bacterium]